MTAPSPPPAAAPDDPEHGPGSTLPPSLPADIALWNAADERTLRGPSATFSDPPPGPLDAPPATIGHIGRYALRHQLGEGGIGTVYAAHDPLLSRQIAVKTLHVEVAESQRESFNAMFLNEARAAAGLSHPHIVTVFDAGISDDRAYIAMEQLKGRDLRQLLQEGWRATPAQAALIVRRVADALGYAHSKGVVHRDVKPANIFMVGQTQPKVLDFGIARIAHQHETQGPGEIAAGSPAYMAPEQARQETVDRRADVFSLGVVFYELLTGVKPFRGETLDEITRAVLHHEPPPAHAVDPSVPRALSQIAAKALAKDPELRYRSARAFSRELRHWLDDNAVSSEGEVRGARGARRVSPLWLTLGTSGAVVLATTAWALLAPPPAVTPEAARATVIDAANAAPSVSGSTTSAALATLAAAPPVDGAASPPAFPEAAEVAEPAMRAAVTPAPFRAVRESREALRERALRPAREARASRDQTTRTAAAATARAAGPATGVVRIAISPWGEVEVNGRAAGTSPPLTELRLPAGRHRLVVRNSDLPVHSATVVVGVDRTATFKHKF